MIKEIFKMAFMPLMIFLTMFVSVFGWIYRQMDNFTDWLGEKLEY